MHAGRVIFGAWMLANGVNHFFLPLWPIPTGHEPPAIELMGAFVHTHLMDVAMLIELITGALRRVALTLDETGRSMI